MSFTGALLMLRVIRTHELTFVFIPWNLFLALTPLYFSHMITQTKDRVVAWGFFLTWLLFFPNAMYIVTDLFHLHERAFVPEWYDLLILFSAAINGMIIGLVSLHNVEGFLRKTLPTRYLPVFIFLMFLLCGYGIYLGRYLRWNSWDIFTQPWLLLLDIGHDIRHPFTHNQSWMVSCLFATWLYILYLYFRKFKQLQ